jgi:hypothetical protein
MQMKKVFDFFFFPVLDVMLGVLLLSNVITIPLVTMTFGQLLVGIGGVLMFIAMILEIKHSVNKYFPLKTDE